MAAYRQWLNRWCDYHFEILPMQIFIFSVCLPCSLLKFLGSKDKWCDRLSSPFNTHLFHDTNKFPSIYRQMPVLTYNFFFAAAAFDFASSLFFLPLFRFVIFFFFQPHLLHVFGLFFCFLTFPAFCSAAQKHFYDFYLTYACTKFIRIFVSSTMHSNTIQLIIQLV